MDFLRHAVPVRAGVKYEKDLKNGVFMIRREWFLEMFYRCTPGTISTTGCKVHGKPSPTSLGEFQFQLTTCNQLVEKRVFLLRSGYR